MLNRNVPFLNVSELNPCRSGDVKAYHKKKHVI